MSEEILSYRDHENQIFKNYYFNNYIPSTLGGAPDTAILQFLIALQISLNTSLAASDILRGWIGDVSWFTSRLEDIFQVPRFEDDSDREYYDRLVALIDAKQDEATTRVAIGTMINNAITSLQADVTFSYQVAQGNWGDDAVPSSFQLFWNNSPNDLWGDANTSLRATTKITMQFADKVTTGLLGWWRLDNDSKDNSGNGYDGTDSGVTYNYAKWNYGGIFDGMDDNISFSTSALATATGSISLWIKSNDLSLATEHAVKHNKATDDLLIYRVITTGNMEIVLGNTTIYNGVMLDDKWYHVVLTWDGAVANVYVNNTQVVTDLAYTGFTALNANFTLGDTTNSWDGMIDEARTYNTELTITEVGLLYNYKTTYDYWSASMNYTKLYDIINLYRPPGTTVEIELLAP